VAESVTPDDHVLKEVETEGKQGAVDVEMPDYTTIRN
jgi:hypothetical protein